MASAVGDLVANLTMKTGPFSATANLSEAVTTLVKLLRLYESKFRHLAAKGIE